MSFEVFFFSIFSSGVQWSETILATLVQGYATIISVNYFEIEPLT